MVQMATRLHEQDPEGKEVPKTAPVKVVVILQCILVIFQCISSFLAILTA